MAITAVGDVSYDQTAYNMLVSWPLRAEMLTDQIADVRATRQAMRGAAVVFSIATEMAAATTPLTETTDVTPVAIANSQVTLTLNEYGNAAGTTAKLRLTSFVEVDPVVANLIAYNAGDSMDTVAINVLVAGTNVRYGGNATSRTTLDATTPDTISSSLIRRTTADLRTAKVASREGGFYTGFIHPDVSYDLRSEVGAGGWRLPQEYQNYTNIMQGEIGAYESVRFIESARAPIFVNASDGAGGAGNIDAYATIIVGQEALAKAHANSEGYGPNPQVVISPQTDYLRRFKHVGWKHFAAYGIFRQAAVRRIETVSTIGNNAS